MRLSDYPRCPICGRVSKDGKEHDRCRQRVEREREQRERDAEILRNYRYRRATLADSGNAFGSNWWGDYR